MDAKRRQQQKVVWEDLQRSVKGSLTFLDSERCGCLVTVHAARVMTESLFSRIRSLSLSIHACLLPSGTG